MYLHASCERTGSYARPLQYFKATCATCAKLETCELGAGVIAMMAFAAAEISRKAAKVEGLAVVNRLEVGVEVVSDEPTAPVVGEGE